VIKDCHSFERRIHELMDNRIDPETDEALWQHGATCADCYQSLMACSLLHSEFLHDSDSMKIKLDSIGLCDLQIQSERHRPAPRYFAAVACGLAAICLIALGSIPAHTDQAGSRVELADRGGIRVAAKLESAAPQVDYSSEQAVQSLISLKETLDPFELSSLTADWSTFRGVKSLSACLEWLQRSWHRKTRHRDEGLGVGVLNRCRDPILLADAVQPV